VLKLAWKFNVVIMILDNILPADPMSEISAW
jgi:hypothetical protein